MNLLLAITAGVLFSSGLYMVLRRSLTKILIGLMLLSYAVNLLLFTSAPLTPARPPLIPDGASQPAGAYADPVPQALILTAIVISFGVTAFAVVLLRQAYRATGTDDLNDMRCTDLPCQEVRPEEVHPIEEEIPL